MSREPPPGFYDDFDDYRPLSTGPSLAQPKDEIPLLDGSSIAVPIPHVECLVDEIGLVAGGGATHLVAGYGYSGKTLALQSLALSVAGGAPVWGVYRGRKGRALHVDLEQGDRLTRRRYQRLAAAMGIPLAPLGDAIAVAIMPRISLRRDHYNAWRRLMQGRDLVIIDSLRAASGGLDENSSEIRACLDMLSELSEATHCRPVLIHHSRKPQEGAAGGRFAIRGSSAIYDACDSVYLFSSAKGEPVSVEHAKARTKGDSVPDFALAISDVAIGDDPRGGLKVQVHGRELVQQQRQKRQESDRAAQSRFDSHRIRMAVTGRPGLTTAELRGITRLSGDRVAAGLLLLSELVEAREEANPRGAPFKRYYPKGTP